MTRRRSYLLVLIIWVLFAGYVWFSAGQLPERVATHFGANGEPNGWETHDGYVRFTLLFGALIPAFILGIFAYIGFADGRGLNMPHKDYWLAPERRAQTFDFIQRQGFWFAGLIIAFFMGIHHSILAANARSPAALPTVDVVWIAGPFLVAVFVWAAIFIGHFSRKTA